MNFGPLIIVFCSMVDLFTAKPYLTEKPVSIFFFLPLLLVSSALHLTSPALFCCGVLPWGGICGCVVPVARQMALVVVAWSFCFNRSDLGCSIQRLLLRRLLGPSRSILLLPELSSVAVVQSKPGSISSGWQAPSARLCSFYCEHRSLEVCKLLLLFLFLFLFLLFLLFWRHFVKNVSSQLLSYYKPDGSFQVIFKCKLSLYKPDGSF